MNSSGRIGLIIPEIVDPLDYELITGAFSQAKMIGYDLIIYTGIFNSIKELQYDIYVESLENIYSLICKNHLDGIIFAAERFHNPELIDKIFGYLSQTKIPCLTLGVKRGDYPYINAAQYDGMYNITKHIINEHNCRKLYCLTGIPGHEPSEERLRGFMDAAADSGITVEESDIFYGYFWTVIPTEIGQDIASGKIPKPDAVVCTSDVMASSLCKALIENRISVPDDIAVTGYDGGWYAFLSEPQITTVTGRELQFGADAVCKLYEMITGTECEKIELHQNICFGESCGCNHNKISENRHNSFSIDRHLKQRIQHMFDKKTFIATDFIYGMSDAASIEELADNIDNVGHILKYWEWLEICLCEDWKMDFENPANFRQYGFSDKIYLLLSKRFGENEKSHYYFPSEDILPALSVPHEPHIVVLTSLHCKGQIFGYTAISYNDPSDIEIDEHYVNWCDAVSNGLKSLQKKLYIDYIRNQMVALSVIDSVTGMLNKRGFTERIPETLNQYRNQNKRCVLLLISFFSENEILSETSLITANTIKNRCGDDKLCAKIEEDIIAVLYSAENGSDIRVEAQNLIAEIETQMREIRGNTQSVSIPEFIIEISELKYEKLSRIEQLFDESLRRISDRKNAAKSHYISYKEQIYRVRRDIMTQPQLNWNIPDISTRLGISQSHFKRLYRQFFSISCKDDIISARMSKSMQLLSHTDMRVQEIALQCGYNSESHFMRQFKEKNGITAVQYRNTNKNKL